MSGSWCSLFKSLQMEVSMTGSERYTEGDVRLLTEEEILQISGGWGPRELIEMGQLPPMTVTGSREWGGGGYMPAGFWGDVGKIGIGIGIGSYQAEQSAKQANEKDISDKFISPTSGIGVKAGESGQPHPVFINSQFGVALGVELNNGFYAADRDRNGAYDYVISPPWTNNTGRVMTYERGVWGFKW
ncbi:hypothetical protein [Variovorax atrisoli]|uniref:hypothetical protein n=1 Tax=Variovorax atrisoli TaxID=3394203 RepID=UPI0011AABCBA|nr:hypothetical protein [Variovorax paradoxus]MDR6518903.1 hypothetical protein [Variovorax paradoxus]